MSMALVPIGLLADALGRKPVLIAGMTLLIATSIGCASADSIEIMLALRFLQGIGGAACQIISYSIAADRFRDRELTAVSGLLGAAWGMAPMLAPAAGGLLVQYASWRVVFLVIGALHRAGARGRDLRPARDPAGQPPSADRPRGRMASVVRGALADRRFLGRQ